MKRIPNIHPGSILEEEFLIPLAITAYRLSKETGIPQTRVSQIIKKRRGITADTAIRFSKFFGTSPQFWLGLQNDYDLEEEMLKKKREFSAIHNFKEVV
ncbi:addiction module antidote protein, HigA family [Leptospira perolatii]|uniref:Addiction module antidote protein, HigA family n=1 Tax=Leptospira perolatii TaxID=2023191 RepID=A0A2M9ZNW0_9LEPT|nr:HigA family addiction module antitoxin [Leptospira perolatii]PJZ70828.1 addiction module antidote protein, HigA family [Leptospira perolatii]PJZ73724.1 addiction module antidote protein, HigA family [Leptospira perolatii]